MKRVVIFGATGDLTARYLIPALAKLYEAGRLPDGIKIIGVDRRGWKNDKNGFRRLVLDSLERHAGSVSAAARARLVTEVIEYRRADVTDAESVISALEPLAEPILAYLALPPAVFAPTLEALKKAGLPEGSRIAIEKPFGVNLESAQSLNRLLHEFLPEKNIYRIDHFLAWQPFPTIMGLRFANGILEPLWDRNYIERVEILWEETLALEGRAGYFDHAGAFKDLIQNHLLQLMCLTAMEAPTALHRRNLRDRKVDLMRAIRRLSPEEARGQTVRARYGTGKIGEKEIPAYADEEGVDPSRGTETFAEVTLAVDNLRWAGVPFVLRGGKALSGFKGEIAVHFKPVPHLAFQRADDPRPNVLRVRLGPDRVTLSLNVNGPHDPFDLEQIELGADFAPQEFFAAYQRVFLDLLEGNTTLFIRADEAEEAWRVSEPILQAWEEGLVPLLEYPAGADGHSVARSGRAVGV
ncbi:glucose-6-phosphate dehydrogenase [Rubrobacter tropicus]|uniref:Glucose-6-phosphate 1-dehydrogenase n=1 Tax=Rubrobacter tropicus TaxID=2653851 RepID=A0A6G8Q6X6_9ACTN|nr:glucose-6-phosphate dehydrogenase [Rubrobacter tropicus]QIN82203.1 glucose-6-phosphate dehydrogenase [Rubrobacter tropicus]